MTTPQTTTIGELYQKPPTHKKLKRRDILVAMANGAILSKRYEVYSYFCLTFPDGTTHYNIRKGATNGISSIYMKNIELIQSDKKGYSYKMVGK